MKLSLDKNNMEYDTFIVELEKRGFTNTESIGSIGGCHRNEEHYILFTDGLVIYSTIPYWDNVKYLPAAICETWEFTPDEFSSNPFTFEKLDRLLLP